MAKGADRHGVRRGVRGEAGRFPGGPSRRHAGRGARAPVLHRPPRQARPAAGAAQRPQHPGVFAAHIHLGRPGVNGPIVMNLYGPTDPVDIGPETQIVNRAFTRADLVGPLAGRPLSDLLQNMLAGNAYVNVHTVQHFEGEIRGQIFLARHGR
ncbi:CHRD domain-containing protein [Thermaerobacter sp. FW80]|nr:CHRD domain-containing protein [Thermaerobacter sp. FW80]